MTTRTVAIAGLVSMLCARLGAAQPVVTVGSAAGLPGQTVTIAFDLSKNGVNVVTFAPLHVTFDAALLQQRASTSEVSGKAVTAAVPSPGLLSVVVQGGLSVFADGTFMHCTFLIQPGAPAGDTPLTFVKAELSDDAFNDLNAAGTSGTVTVNVPTSTPTRTATPLGAACVGDCDGDGVVGVGEVITGVTIALGSAPLAACVGFDANGDGAVAVNELLQAVRHVLDGCGGLVVVPGHQ